MKCTDQAQALGPGQDSGQQKSHDGWGSQAMEDEEDHYRERDHNHNGIEQLQFGCQAFTDSRSIPFKHSDQLMTSLPQVISERELTVFRGGQSHSGTAPSSTIEIRPRKIQYQWIH